MKKDNFKRRFLCKFCGAKRYLENLFLITHNGVIYYSCKNEDLCVLKMSYNKKILKKK